MGCLRVNLIFGALALAVAACANADEAVTGKGPTTRPDTQSAPQFEAESVRPRRIVFVCDGSDSMSKTLPVLKDQLRKTVMALKPNQSFEMIFLQDTVNDSFNKYVHGTGLIPATPENRRFAYKWLEGVSTTTRSTDPIAGIEAAFKTKPLVIYLLTNRDFADNDAVGKKVTELNKDHAVKINTIAFVGEGDKDTAFLDLLKKIAEQNGGTFAYVKASELRD